MIDSIIYGHQMSKIDNFKRLYRRLNPAQREAVDTIDGPVMVIAGPGTGKTQILTLRIANILRLTDTSPDSILALTFTNSGVHSMRRRLVEIVGATGYRVPIFTFHSFANSVIRHYPEFFPRIIGARPALLVDQIRLLERLIDETKLVWLRPQGSRYYYLRPVLAEIERLKKENLSPRALRRALNDQGPGREAEKNQELAKLYARYEQALRTNQLYDFADMIMAVLEALEQKSDLRSELQERYQYILADEHQDANQSQNDLLARLSDYDPRPNLFIVGDEKQAIFQFQGASLDNFNFFRGRYPLAKIVTLTDNYRSSQGLIDAAHSVMAHSALPETSRPRLRGAAAGDREIHLRVSPDEATELHDLVEGLRGALAAGTPAEEIAVLYHDNRDARELVAALERAGLPFSISSEANVLHDPDLKKLLLVFDLLHHFGQEEKLLPVLHLDLFQLSPLVLHRLAERGRAARKKLWTVFASAAETRDLIQKFAKLRQASFNTDFAEFFGRVLRETGFLEHLLRQPAATDKLARLQALFDNLRNILAGKPDFSLADFQTYLELLTTHHLPINLPTAPASIGLRLLTCHRAKGLEFDQVYLVRAFDGHFGGRRERRFFSLPLRGSLAPDSGDDADRRLFYVALTRARRRVTISYGGTQRLPSRFLEEIEPSRLKRVAVAARPPAEATWRPRQFTGPSLTDRAYLNQLFFDQGLSVTALNNFLACPLKYFFQNLLRVTRVQSKALLYGSAIHTALKSCFDLHAGGRSWSERQLLAAFGRELGRAPLVPSSYRETLARGRSALRGWYRHYRGAWSREISNEFKIKGVLLGRGIRLRGQIDKLEHLPGGEVQVVDYKTGLPKSRNEILGRTKAATGDYYRQLLFYKILLEHFDRGRFRVIRGVLDFIEPNSRGRYKKEVFDLPPAAAKELQVTIEAVAASILDLTFLHRGCGHCEACQLWSLTGQRL